MDSSEELIDKNSSTSASNSAVEAKGRLQKLVDSPVVNPLSSNMLNDNMESLKAKDEYNDRGNSFQNAMCSILVTAQCFGLLPVCGITSQSANSMRFTWRSFRFFYSIIGIFGTCFNIIISILLIQAEGLMYERVDKIVLYGTSALMYFQFLVLGKNWPNIASEWEIVEESQKHYGYPKKLRLKTKILTAVVLLGALVEHALGHVNILRWAGCCQGDISGMLKRYFVTVHSQLFKFIPYSVPLAVTNALLNIITTFTWNFTDLFIMLISLCLAERFSIFNVNLEKVKGKVLEEKVWKRLREEYNSLAILTKLLNSHVTVIVLISYASNLYFICRQLLSSLNPLGNSTEVAYFYWSFGFVLFRTITVSLSAARVNEESQIPKSVIYSVPSESYGTEVSRLIQQITTDNIVLTGMNFFSVTRTLLLTLAGTIVTYEIVLVQFNNINGAGSSTEGNSTNTGTANGTNS